MQHTGRVTAELLINHEEFLDIFLLGRKSCVLLAREKKSSLRKAAGGTCTFYIKIFTRTCVRVNCRTQSSAFFKVTPKTLLNVNANVLHHRAFPHFPAISPFIPRNPGCGIALFYTRQTRRRKRTEFKYFFLILLIRHFSLPSYCPFQIFLFSSEINSIFRD